MSDWICVAHLKQPIVWDTREKGPTDDPIDLTKEKVNTFLDNMSAEDFDISCWRISR